MVVTHSFGPFYDAQSRVLILGTMPSPKSREAGFYYAHPQNRFWRVLPMVYGEAPLVGDIAGQKAFLTRRHIALWDVLAACEITGASDASIRDPVRNPIQNILHEADIRAIFCTGQKSGALYRRYCEKSCGMPARVLPSPSPANCAVKLDALLAQYAAIRQITEEQEKKL